MTTKTTDTTKDLAAVRFALNFFDPKPDPESEDTAVVTCAHEALNRLADHLESGSATKSQDAGDTRMVRDVLYPQHGNAPSPCGVPMRSDEEDK